MLGIVGLLLGAGWICAGAAATHPLWAVVFLSLGAGSLFLGVPSYFATTIDLAKTHAGIAGDLSSTELRNEITALRET